MLSSACERVDEIRITESVDCGVYESAGTMAAMMADARGADLDRMTFDVQFTAATDDTDLGFMQIPKGTVASVPNMRTLVYCLPSKDCAG